jgi:subtilisin family serine protease
MYSFSPWVISVGSITKAYNKSSFSNFGSCVDIWSFGDSVPTAYSIKDNTTVQYKSGTSFSSPLVAGMVVNLLRQNNTLNKDQILSILFNKVNSFVVPLYECGKEFMKCCQGYVKGARLDKYCRSLSLSSCERSCKIGLC